MHVRAEVLRHGVKHGEIRDRAAHQADPDQPRRRSLVRTGSSAQVARPPEMSNTAPVENEHSAGGAEGHERGDLVDLDEAVRAESSTAR